MWYSGIDQHKRDSVITTYGPEGPRVKQARVANTPLVMAQSFAEFPGPHHAVVESTGGWYWLADMLVPLGVELVLAHATRVKAIATAKVKTDQVDSDTLALLLRAELIPTAHMIAPAQRGPRDLMRARLRLVEKSVSAQDSIDRLLEKFNITDVRRLEPAYQLQAACHQAQLQLLDDQITTLERALYPDLIPNVDVHRLLWIPGLGKVNAFTLYTAIDDIGSFPSVRQFFSYCRLVPRGRQLRRPHPASLGLQGWQPLSQARFQSREYPGGAVLPGDPELLQGQGQEKADPHRAHPGGARTGTHRLPGSDEARDFNGQFKNRPLTRRKNSQWPRRASPPA